MSTDITDHPSLGSKLVKLLGLPKNTENFSLHFPLEDVITVKCEYYPEILDTGEAGELVSLFKRYRLEEILEEKPEEPEAVQ